ncbi:SPX domain-containing membrane protein At4g22990, partial [Linum perenne]
ASLAACRANPHPWNPCFFFHSYYINYKLLKKRVNRYTQLLQSGTQDQKSLLKDFSRLLDSQIERIVMFMLEKQGGLAARLASLGEQQQQQQQHYSCNSSSELRDSYRAVGEELLRLLNFVEMNAIGLRKILKKFDKRFGSSFTDYYVKTRSNHPYSQLRSVFKQVGIGAVVGAISRNLTQLEGDKNNYSSIYDQPQPPLSQQDPVIDSIKAAVNRLSNSTNFLEYLGKHAFIFQDDIIRDPSDDDDQQFVEERYNLMSLLLNLANTFLYMVNTYIIVPTADSYSLTLGAAATVCGVIIGSMAIAQIFSSLYFSAWSNRSYFRPLVFSSIMLLVGNTMYALAYDLNSISILLIGRLFCGLGSARAVNRRYISDCVPLKFRMQASVGFVSASALGMASGPALACLFQTNFKICNLTFNEATLPGWFMAFLWLLYLSWLWFSFREPPTPVTNNMPIFRYSMSMAGPLWSDAMENGSTQPLLLESEAKYEDEDDDQELDGGEGDSEASHEPVTSIVSAYQLLTPAVKVQLFVYFMLKYAMEILLAESSLITGYYFIWSTRSVAIFLACLGLTVLPVNVVVGHYISNIFEERQVLLASEIMVCIGILSSFHIIIPYSAAQYVSSALITFVSAEVLEGVNLSLLSRGMSSRLSKGTFNGGLLSTEAGTIARVIADGTITLSGYLEENMLLNVTLLPSLFICVSSIVATCVTYNSLY